MKTQIIIAGTTVTFVSPHTMDELKKVAKFKPAAITLHDEEGVGYFDILPSTVPIITKKMIGYADSAPDGTGRACVSVPLPVVNGMSPSQAVASEFGPTIANANKVEEQISAALDEVNSMLQDVENGIVVATGN